MVDGINDVLLSIQIVNPGDNEFLIKEVRFLEYDSYDFAASFSANLN